MEWEYRLFRLSGIRRFAAQDFRRWCEKIEPDHLFYGKVGIRRSGMRAFLRVYVGGESNRPVSEKFGIHHPGRWIFPRWL